MTWTLSPLPPLLVSDAVLPLPGAGGPEKRERQVNSGTQELRRENPNGPPDPGNLGFLTGAPVTTGANIWV